MVAYITFYRYYAGWNIYCKGKHNNVNTVMRLESVLLAGAGRPKKKKKNLIKLRCNKNRIVIRK